MNYTAWTLFSDVGLMAILLIIGQMIRSKVKIFQKFLIPPSLIAGFLGLAFGPNGFGVIPFSSSIGTYASILIVVIFAAMPIGDSPTKEQLSGPAIGGMFLNVTGIAVLQYGVGMFLAIYVLGKFYNLNPGFGLMLATGFYGGHGTAAAVGSAYEKLGWAEATGLGMTSATVGIVGGIISGVVLINWATRKGYTHYVGSPKDLPEELKTGLIRPDKQKSGGKITISSICLDPMSFHLGIVLVASVAGYYAAEFIAKLIPSLAIPAFCISLLFGFILQFILKKTKTDKYIDRYTISRISGTATDFLIISGVASVKISLVIQYFVPLIVTFAVGFIINILWLIFIGGKSSTEDWLERNMMVYGHATGVVATGILLQRIVDPDLKSRGMEDSGISDIINRPLIVALQVLPPVLISQGGMWPHVVTWACLGIVIIMIAIAYKFKWWNPRLPLKVYNITASKEYNLEKNKVV